MAPESVGKGVCPFCAVEVREEALFCFNCGKSVVQPEADALPEPVHFASDEVQRQPAEEAAEGVPDARPAPSRVKVAPAPRRRPRPGSRREVEISWVRPDEGPGAQFVLGTAGIAAVSVLLLLVALYLR